MGKLIIRKYSETDKLQIVELLQKGLTKDFTIQRWNWLYHNMTTQGAHIAVAVNMRSNCIPSVASFCMFGVFTWLLP